MDAIAAIHGRRSIRAYQARSVERDLVEAIIWDAAQAPSTPVSGAQPWAFNIIQGAERIADYSARAKRFARRSTAEPIASRSLSMEVLPTLRSTR